LSNFPRTVEEITPEWLTQVLRESGAIRDARVDSFESTNVGDGKGILAEVSRVDLNYSKSDNQAPESLIVKLSLADDARRTQLQHVYQTEVNFYQQLAPETGLKTPEVYFADFDPETGYSNLVLEDLSGMRSPSDTVEPSIEDYGNALDSLASMHAKWWCADRLNDFPWLPVINDPRFHQFFTEFFTESIDLFLDLAGNSIPLGYEKIARNMYANFDVIWEVVNTLPITLTHGDFRLANMFFDDSSGENPVVIFDWQTTVISFAGYDLAKFIRDGMSIDERRADEASLIKRYHTGLVNGGLNGYSHDDLMYSLRVGSILLMFRELRVLRMQILTGASTERIQARVDSMCIRDQTIVDWNCEEVIPK